MAYNFNPNNNDELSLEELEYGLGGSGLSYEEAREFAIKHGMANASHGGPADFNNGELSEEELDNYLGGVPYEESSGRRR